MQGLIALDIDGTLTTNPKKIENKIWDGLLNFYQKGWQFLFVTGRTLVGAKGLFENTPLPSYYLSCYNGAYTLEFPSNTLKKKHFLSFTNCIALDTLLDKSDLDYIIFGGPFNEDTSYFRPQTFPKHLENYAKERQKLLHENWKAVSEFSPPNIPDTFPAIKLFASREELMPISDFLEEKEGMHAPIIKDPYVSSIYLLQATHGLASKGQALKEIHQEIAQGLPTIAAGDDINDLSMLEYADIGITFETASAKLKEKANLIAPFSGKGWYSSGIRKSYPADEEVMTTTILSTIELDHLEIQCIIGDLPHERLHPQQIFLDLSFQILVKTTDLLEDTVDYVQVIDHCKKVAISGKYKLIETLAYTLLQSLPERFPDFQNIKLKVKKPQLLLGLNYTSVELRSKNG